MSKKIVLIVVSLLMIVGAFVIATTSAVILNDSSPVILSGSEESQFYQSKDYGFSFDYPSELDLREFYDEEGETVVFQKGTEKIGFQIFITSIEGDVITRERILKDLPSTVIEDPKEVIVGDGTRALVFWSESPAIGRTREVWFARNGYLYEITTYAALDAWLANILKTWKFS